MAREEPLAIRSYRLCFELERRIHKIDRWRIPPPYGVPLRGVAYGAGALVVVLVASGLPLIGPLLLIVHPAIRLIVAPVAVAYALYQLRIDGRPAHAAGLAWARMWLGPRRLCAFRPAPPPGAQRLGDLTLAPDERSCRYRPAVLRGPATVLLRYPASARRRGRTLSLRQRERAPMWRGKRISLCARQRVRQPISFIYRNLVFGSRQDEAWALLRLATRPYAGLTRQAKRELLAALAGLAYALGADFQLLRVSRPWSVESYLRGCEAQADSRHGTPLLAGYLERHRTALAGMAIERPEVFLAVALGANEGHEDGEGPARWLAQARGLLGLDDPRGLSGRRLERLLAEARAVEARVGDYLDCEPAATHELQWLIRRAFTRSASEPVCDERFLTQALVIEEPDGVVYRPLEHDLLRLFDCPIEIAPRSLRVDCERGPSHQAPR